MGRHGLRDGGRHGPEGGQRRAAPCPTHLRIPQALSGDPEPGAMIVCHCQSITDRDVHAAIDWMRAADAHTIITPGKVYRALGNAADCGSCVSARLALLLPTSV